MIKSGDRFVPGFATRLNFGRKVPFYPKCFVNCKAEGTLDKIGIYWSFFWEKVGKSSKNPTVRFLSIFDVEFPLESWQPFETRNSEQIPSWRQLFHGQQEFPFGVRQIAIDLFDQLLPRDFECRKR